MNMIVLTESENKDPVYVCIDKIVYVSKKRNVYEHKVETAVFVSGFGSHTYISVCESIEEVFRRIQEGNKNE